MPEAKIGEWEFAINTENNYNEKYGLPVIKKMGKWVYIKKISDKKLYYKKYDNYLNLILVSKVKDGYAIYLEAKLRRVITPFRNSFQMFCIKNYLFENRRLGYATSVYLSCLRDLGITIVSDSAQFDNVRRIYKNLNQRHNINVAICNDIQIFKENIDIIDINSTDVWFIYGQSTDSENKYTHIVLRDLTTLNKRLDKMFCS